MLLLNSFIEQSDGIVKLMLDNLFQQREFWTGFHEDAKEVRINRETWHHLG